MEGGSDNVDSDEGLLGGSTEGEGGTRTKATGSSSRSMESVLVIMADVAILLGPR